MHVVDAVEIHVFSVPGKSGFPHAKIQVSCVHSFNSNAAVQLYNVQQRVQPANVPHVHTLRWQKKRKTHGLLQKAKCSRKITHQYISSSHSTGT